MQESQRKTPHQEVACPLFPDTVPRIIPPCQANILDKDLMERLAWYLDSENPVIGKGIGHLIGLEEGRLQLHKRVKKKPRRVY